MEKTVIRETGLGGECHGLNVPPTKSCYSLM